MADYIKREDVLHALFNGEHNLYSWFEIEEKLDAIPSADVQPVVRCKDCKHLSFVDRFCYKNSIFVCSMDWFCAGGERRGGGT